MQVRLASDHAQIVQMKMCQNKITTISFKF